MTIQKDQMWSATFSYKTPYLEPGEPVTESSTTVTYQSHSWKTAIRDALRWWRAREKNVPDYFKDLWCVKIYAVSFGHIDEEGNIPHHINGAGTIYECKIDHKLREESYEDHAERYIARRS